MEELTLRFFSLLSYFLSYSPKSWIYLHFTYALLDYLSRLFLQSILTSGVAAEQRGWEYIQFYRQGVYHISKGQELFSVYQLFYSTIRCFQFKYIFCAR